MQLNRYKIEFTAKENGELAGFLGNVIRGSLGQALFDIDKNIYDIFYNKNFKIPKTIDKIVKQNPPSPFAINVMPTKREINKGEKIQFILTVFGKYNQHIQQFIPVFEKMATDKINNISFEFTGMQKIPNPVNANTSYRLTDFENLSLDHETFTLHFERPVMLESNKKLITDFSFKKIFPYIDQRLFVLDQIYGNATYKPVDKIPEILINKIQLKKFITLRTPANAKPQTKMAWTGQIQYHTKQEIQQIIPTLLFGQYIQIGSGTSFGFGKYTIK